MAEPASNEEKAALYVLGELDFADRQAFEVQLAESAELRVLVTELEEGTLALATTSLRNAPPASVWTKIEESIADERQQEKVISLFSGIWRNGWAAAAACLIGWLLYALSIDRSVNQTPKAPSILQVEPNRANASVNNSIVTKTNFIAHAEAEKERETVILRNQLVGLQRQVDQLSQSVTQQQALLNESSRLKFVQLIPAGSGGNTTAPRPLSPALQRALFLAMARELGWLSSTNDASGARSPEIFSGPGASNQFNVDFVDAQPGKANSEPSRLQSEPQNPPSETKTVASSQAPAPAVIFTSGENLVVALDSAIAPAGTELAFSSFNGEFLGRTVIGENPLVFRSSVGTNSSSLGSSIVITATPPGGDSYMLQFEAALGQ